MRLRQRVYRQFFIKDLGHDQPTILLSNDTRATARQLVTRYLASGLINKPLSVPWWKGRPLRLVEELDPPQR